MISKFTAPGPHSSRSVRLSWLLACAGVAALLCAAPARAEDSGPSPDQSASNPDDAAEPCAIDWSLLDSDIAALPGKAPKSGVRKSGNSDPGMNWKRADNGNGSSAVSVKQSIVPFWDTRIGGDMNVVSRTPTTSSEVLAQKIAGDGLSQSNGSAWAGLTAPGVGTIWDKTSVEARIDPSQDQSRFGTSLSKSLPLGGDRYSLTLQNGYNVIQQGAMPLVGALSGSSRNLEIDNSAKLNVLGTGTSLIAGQTLSTADEKWLSHVGAEQKLFDGVSITGSISETVEGYADRSLRAGYKYSW